MIYGGTRRSARNIPLEAFVDLDYVERLDDIKSLTYYFFTACGTTISWKASLQKVTLSTTKAQYIAMIEALNEALWLKGIGKELRVQEQIVTVYCDSNRGILLSMNQVYHERTKHIDVKLHFLREKIA